MFTRTFTHAIASLVLLVSSHSTIAGPVQISSPQAAVPPNITTSSNRPMVMLTTSKDHTLFGPIYTDFEDLDGDGVLDTDFKPSFKYYGYFDPTKCYSYSTSDERFNPATNANYVNTARTNPSTGAIETLYRWTCPSTENYWSGNFLNWSSMSRLDVVRKMLYGGRRYSDTSSTTILERAYLSFDAHSYTKYYKGTDIRDYTPFTTAALTKAGTGPNAGVYAGLTVCNTGETDSPTAKPIMRMAVGNYRLWGTVEHEVCRFRDVANDGDAKFTAKLARYYKDADKGGGGIAHEIQTPHSTDDAAKYGSTIGPELTMRVKVCDPTTDPRDSTKSLLGEERCQAFPPDSTTNFKPYGLFQEFGFNASGSAARAEFGVITGSYDQNTYAGALRKNMGDFSDEINPSTGVFCHSTSSGCSTTLTDGRTTGNGSIKAMDNIILYGRTSRSYGGSTIGSLPAWGNPIGEMLIQALKYYSYDGTNPTPDNPSTTTKDTNTGLPVKSWTDPQSNSNTSRYSQYGNAICRPMYALALSSSALSYDGENDNAKDSFANLPNRYFSGNSANSKTLDNFTDAVGDAELITGTVRSVGRNGTNNDLSCSGKTVGSLSGVLGVCPEAPAMQGSFKVAGAAYYANTNRVRNYTTLPTDIAYVQDALKVKTLAASLSGGAARIEVPVPGTNPTKYVYITPESVWGSNIGAPLTFASISSSSTHGAFIVTWNDALLGGDYDMDLTGFLRYDIVADSASPSGYSIKITTDVPSTCSGAGGTHGFSIIGGRIPGQTTGDGRYLTHQHYKTDKFSGITGNLCADDTYRAANSSSTLNSSTLGYFTFEAKNPDGTTFAGTSPINAKGACYVNPWTTAARTTATSGSAGYCNVQDVDFKVITTFYMVGAGDAILKDPLWYAAKYGNFTSSVKATDGTYSNVYLPTDTASWDKLKSDGTPGADGIPDGYYLARRPDLLEAQLRKALDDLAKNSNAAPAVSSAQLQSDGFKYIAKFDSTAVEGNIEAYQVDSLGYFNSDYTWRAGQLLATRTSNSTNGDKGESRIIITNYGNKNTTSTSTSASTGGFAFRWSSLPEDYKTQMTSASTNRLSETNASLVVDYMRGDQTKEAASTGLRSRGDNILGPIVNATPAIQERPFASYSGNLFPDYSTFVTDNKARAKLLWVAANDGMLHAFNPTTGAEVFAYVPGVLANRLAEIPLQRGTTGRTRLNGANFTLDSVETQPTGTVWPYVDGNPFSGDILVTSGSTSTWKTYTFGTLGRGGRAIYALNTGDISTLTSGESNTNPDSIFKWQFTSDDDSDLGYIVYDILNSPFSNQPSPIVKLNNGKFAILLGNGQKSSNGKSALFIIYTDGPNSNGTWTGKYKKIVADSGSGNGMSAPTWIDLDGNGTADIVYAGDLKGNMWKFDLTSASESSWDVAYKSGSTNLPLITAKSGSTALPITTAPEFAYPAYDGLIITFGTGNSFEAGNFPNTSVSQRIYGVWDRPEFAAGTRTLPPSDASTLVSRTYERQSNGAVIVTSAGTIDWTTKDGWYFSLPGSSEMVLSDPDIQAGVLAFTTVRAQSSTNVCSAKPDVASFTIDPLTGKPERNIQGTTLVGTTTYLNAGVTALDQKVRIVSDRTKRAFTKQCRAGDAGCTCTTTNGVETCTKSETECPAGTSARRKIGQSSDTVFCYRPSGRMQWREIPGLRTDQ